MVNGVLNAFAYIAKWLREMSLAGGAQNVLAICMFCLIGCVPLAGFIVLCIRNRKIDADYLLLGLSAVLFIGIYDDKSRVCHRWKYSGNFRYAESCNKLSDMVGDGMLCCAQDRGEYRQGG